MVLGLGYGEIALLVGAGAVLFGPKDLARISGYSGRVVGWMVGYLRMARGQLQDMGAASEMASMHHEMQVTMGQLHSIREEIRRGAKILSPVHAISNPGHEACHQNMPALLGHASSDIEQPVKDIANLVPSPLAVPGLGFAAEATKQTHSKEENKISSSTNSTDIGKTVPIPVSALSAGMIESRDSCTYGSDILVDALLEEEVAHKAQHFLTGDK